MKFHTIFGGAIIIEKQNLYGQCISYGGLISSDTTVGPLVLSHIMLVT